MTAERALSSWQETSALDLAGTRRLAWTARFYACDVSIGMTPDSCMGTTESPHLALAVLGPEDEHRCD